MEVEGAVRSAHANTGGCHQIAEGVGLVGDAPAMPDRRRIAGCPQHDLGALVGDFARHLRKHPVMADDEPDAGAVWGRHTPEMPTSPGSQGSTGTQGVQLAVIEARLAGIVEDEADIVWVAVRVRLHD